MFDMKKKKEEMGMNPLEKEAKMGVLSNLKAEGEKGMLDQLKGMKKVEVASDSAEGLKTGLEKARELLDSQAMEDGFKPEIQFTPEEIDEVIEMLLEKKKLLEGGSDSLVPEKEEY